MSDWDYSEVGGQKRWQFTFSGGHAYLIIYLNPGEYAYRWQVVVGSDVAGSGSAGVLPDAKNDARDALIAYAQKLLEAARNLGQ